MLLAAKQTQIGKRTTQCAKNEYYFLSLDSEKHKSNISSANRKCNHGAHKFAASLSGGGGPPQSAYSSGCSSSNMICSLSNPCSSFASPHHLNSIVLSTDRSTPSATWFTSRTKFKTTSLTGKLLRYSC